MTTNTINSTTTMMAAYRVVESGGPLSSEQFSSEQLPERKMVTEKLRILKLILHTINKYFITAKPSLKKLIKLLLYIIDK